jgi:hypothetical protein
MLNLIARDLSCASGRRSISALEGMDTECKRIAYQLACTLCPLSFLNRGANRFREFALGRGVPGEPVLCLAFPGGI